MANIVRCKLPSGTHRFKPFTVADYRDLLIIANEMRDNPDEADSIVNGMLEDYFGDYPESWRHFIFIKVFTTSIGKSIMPVTFTCPKCKKTRKTALNLNLDSLKIPEINTAGVKIKFKFPDKVVESISDYVRHNIDTVSDGTEYKWDDLSVNEKLDVINSVSIESLKDLVDQVNPINVTVNMNCCESHSIQYTSIQDIFNLIINPDSIFMFYQTNHLLAKHNYPLESVMNMIPIERNIALSLIEKDNK